MAVGDRVGIPMIVNTSSDQRSRSLEYPTSGRGGTKEGFCNGPASTLNIEKLIDESC